MAPFFSFLAVAAVAVLVPGPDAFVVLRAALTGGARAGRWAAAGAGVGNVVWGTASALGVAAVLSASAEAFTALKLVGAAYLAFLGVQALRAAARGDGLAPTSDGQATISRLTALWRGLASDLLNVKVGLFWTALVPQFVGAGASPLLPAAMVVAMGAMVFAGLSLYAHLAARLQQALRRRRAARSVNGTLGAVLLGLGGRLAVASH